MRAICVDDERLLMEDTLAMCLKLPGIDEAKGFTKASEALEWLEDCGADVAILDIDMPEMNGLALAAKIKERSPDTAIVFLTGYAEFAVDAFAVRASGYLLKPVTKEALAKEVAYALTGKQKEAEKPVSVKTFGNFEVFVDGRPVRFKMAKCKEIFAYLVDRQGSGVKRAELSAILWEDRLYDRRQQKQLDVYIRALRDTLAEHGIADVFEMHGGALRIVPEKLDCDAYRFFAGDADAVNAYRGEYMSAYSWASFTEGLISQRKAKR